MRLPTAGTAQLRFARRLFFIAVIVAAPLEKVTMLELFILAAGVAAGYAASVYSWPWIRAHAIGAAAEINQLRARAKALEDSIKGAL
jgi:hypothetical protein